MDELIGSTEAAKLLNVSRVSVWRMVDEKRLKPYAVVNRRVIFKKDDILIEAAKRRLQQEAVA
jgi:excisionase family DNA binding protein